MVDGLTSQGTCYAAIALILLLPSDAPRDPSLTRPPTPSPPPIPLPLLPLTLVLPIPPTLILPLPLTQALALALALALARHVLHRWDDPLWRDA